MCEIKDTKDTKWEMKKDRKKERKKKKSNEG